MTTYSDEILRDLQSLIDFLGAHPEIERPTDLSINVYSFEEENLETVSRIARVLGSFNKDIDAGFFRLTKKFGNVTLKYVFYRENVCIKRVVGIRKEKKMVPPTETLMVEIEVETEIVEWNCPSLLEGDKEDA
ncbi:hypothetical protein IID24_04070 [Patescibacteria group bacterium]|nr:hypothetical protein [Patescibacteria group bacterium]